MDILGLLEQIPKGPSSGDSVKNMLIRAIQLFADGERAVTGRQAIVSYVGACDALFGHRGAAEKFTCTGIALVLGYDNDVAYKFAKKLYDQRSRAAHQGFEPDMVDQSRRVAYQSIVYVLKHCATLSSKSKIRNWIRTGFRSRTFRAKIAKVVATIFKTRTGARS